MKKAKTGFGVFTCTVTIVGSMIGSAVFSLSGLTMLNAGPACILSWLVAAVIMFFYGLICSELASRYPHSGGTYLFPAKAFNCPLMGWMSSWGSLLANIVAISFSAIYVGIYLGVGFNISSSMQIPVGIISILFCALINILGHRKRGGMNSILVILLLVTMLIYICCAISDDVWSGGNLTPFFSQGTKGQFGFLSSVPTAMLGFGNVVSMAFLVSLVRKPSETIPKSVCFAIIIVASLYVAMILSTLGLITVSYLKANPGMTYIPMYAACFTALEEFSWMTKLVSVSAVLALLTTNSILIAITSHSIDVAAKDGILPEIFRADNRSDLPVFAMCTVVLISCLISCFPKFTEVIVNYGALFAVVTIVINILSVIKSRQNDGIDGEIYTAPGKKVMPYLLIAVILVCYIPDFISGWQIWLYSAVAYLIGFAIFRIAGKSA